VRGSSWVSFTGHPEGLASYAKACEGRYTTEGVLDRSQRALLTGRTGGGPDLRVKATRAGNGTGGELTSRTGAAERCSQVTTERQTWVLSREGSSSLVRRGGSASERTTLLASNGVVRKRESVDAPEEVHGSWRQRIAAPRLATRIQPARTVLGPERATPLPRCVGRLPGTWAAHEVRNALREHAEARRA